MRIIAFGDLYIDYYFKHNKLEGVMGGKTNANILCNLSKYYETAFLGVVGNDMQGEICIKSLEKLGVDTTHIKKIEYPTKKFYLEDNEYTTTCPYCNRDLRYNGDKYTLEDVIPFIEEDDILIVDELKQKTIELLKKVTNKAFLDLGYIGGMRFQSLDEIIASINKRFEIISMNERVYDYLKNKFTIDSQDLYDYFECKILIVTRGKRGADIIYESGFEKKELENPSIEVDSNGAGDAFFSEFIHIYIESENIDLKMIGKAFLKGSSLSSYVVTKLGARTHLIPLVKIKKYKECICKEIEFDNL